MTRGANQHGGWLAVIGRWLGNGRPPVANAQTRTFDWNSMLQEKAQGTLLPGVMDHSLRHCDGQPTCPKHMPTDHHMRGWPQFHGTFFPFTVRQCPHGELHPDPDDARWGSRRAHVDVCDGCCDPSRYVQTEVP